jgi:murein endopeptidase
MRACRQQAHACTIGGLSRAKHEPAARLRELLQNDSPLAARWEAAVAQAGAIADDPAVAHGTRYDALRLLSAATWGSAQTKLAEHLGPDAHAELQMGAVSALGDFAEPEAAEMLAGALAHLAGHNRQLAIDALCRGAQRVAALRRALAAGTVRPDELTDEQRAVLAGDVESP